MDIQEPQTLAARLQAARVSRGYSLEDLAIATGLTVEEISLAEEDSEKAHAHHIERIRHILD